ncbi:hypothetical protein PIB30_064333 [Stylosanthes scabra]|uniref:Uncharacterized protein n=1 Tax=Stylosanthes scabra TaxID=79078 RepID=A0ABU6XN81_9FABA|nr:hypothetical protein [Stylosanthes scabra]
MPRMKRTARKQPMEDIVYEEPPQDDPLGKYFKTLDDLNGLFDGKHALEIWGPNIKQHAYDLFNIQRQSRKKISCSDFNTEMRVLHYILNYVLMPRAHGHGHVTDDDLVIMIDLSEEVSKTLGNSGVIDIRTLHHMGRAMEDQGQEEEAPQAHQAPQAPQASHEPQASPSQQPSMLDLMHVLQRIEQNQDRMDHQFQSVDRRLHRIEQYLEIEEDEDEDQD